VRDRAIAVVGAIALAIACGATAAATPACTTHQCDPAAAVTVAAGSGGGAPAGFLHDPDTWESNAIDAPWRPYFREEVLVLDFGSPPWRAIESIAVYVSIVGAPLDAGDIFAVATGNLAEISVTRVSPDDAGNPGIFHLNVHNDTCQDYYARVVVRFAPNGAASVTGDAGADGTNGRDAGAD
jgi:hypothetical protein